MHNLKGKINDFSLKEILPFATEWMVTEDTTLGEMSQTQKEKYCTVSLPRGGDAEMFRCKD